MPSILVAIRNAHGLSGAAIMVQREIEHLASRGWSVHLCAQRIDAAWARRIGIRWEKFPTPWFRTASVRRRFAEWVARQSARIRPDLVVGHGDILEQDVLHLHNCVHLHAELDGSPLAPGDPLGDLHADQLTAPGLRVIANSSLMRNDLIGRFAIPPGSITVIHPGFDAARFRVPDPAMRTAARAALGVEGPTRVVALVASGDLHKRGADLLIAAVAELDAQTLSTTRFLIVGKDRDAESLRRTFPRGARIDLLAPRARIEDLYHAIDLLVAPARIEEFGMCVLEAAACGVPLVVSATTGAAEVVGALPGVVVLPDLAIPTIAAAIRTALPFAPRPGPDPRIDRLDWPVHCARVEAVYRERIADAPSPAATTGGR